MADDASSDIRIDLDGTLKAPDGSVEPGAVDALRSLMASGCRVIVWTAAIQDSGAAASVRRWLVDNGVPFDDVQSKPAARAYIDNRAIRYDPQVHPWDSIAGQILGGRGATLRMLIGLPGSGKSTFAKATRGLRVSHDALMHALGDHHAADVAERALVTDALSRGTDVVLDRLSLTAPHRAEWISLARSLGASPVGFFWALGLERQWLGNLDRSETKHVTESDMRDMASRFEEPRSAEGFDALYRVVEDELGFRELRAAVE